jgi:hypothetical protein
MTEVVIKLPDELAQRARNAGLLSDSAIQDLLEDAMRRQTGRQLLDVAQRLQAVGIEPMSIEEIDVEVKAVRTELRTRQITGGGADRS